MARSTAFVSMDSSPDTVDGAQRLRGLDAALLRHGAKRDPKPTTTDFSDVVTVSEQARHDEETGTTVYPVKTIGPNAKERERRRLSRPHQLDRRHLRALTPHRRGRGPARRPGAPRTSSRASSRASSRGDPDLGDQSDDGPPSRPLAVATRTPYTFAYLTPAERGDVVA